MNKIIFNGLELLVLKKLQNCAGHTIHIDFLIQGILSSELKRNTNFNSVIKVLADNQYILFSNNQITLTEQSEAFLNDFDNFESEEILAGNYNFAILKFLYLMKEPVSSLCFPEIIKIQAPKKFFSVKANLEDYLQFNLDIFKYVLIEPSHLYLINYSGIDFVENELKKRTNKFDSASGDSSFSGKELQRPADYEGYTKEVRRKLKKRAMLFKKIKKYSMTAIVAGAMISIVLYLFFHFFMPYLNEMTK